MLAADFPGLRAADGVHFAVGTALRVTVTVHRLPRHTTFAPEFGMRSSSDSGTVVLGCISTVISAALRPPFMRWQCLERSHCVHLCCDLSAFAANPMNRPFDFVPRCEEQED